VRVAWAYAARVARASVRAAVLVALLVASGASCDRARPAASLRAGVAVVGDSLTAPIASSLAARMKRAGWYQVEVDAFPGRQIPSSLGPPLSGVRAVRALEARGFNPPAWIVALGTNDVLVTGDPAAMRTRIEEMLSAIGPRRVLWVNIWRTDTPEFMARALKFNLVLDDVASRHANFDVLDWAATARADPEVFGPDKVHLSRRGQAERVNRVVKGALAVWSS
jgi:lysophospholipase L1-like esterase